MWLPKLARFMHRTKICINEAKVENHKCYILKWPLKKSVLHMETIFKDIKY